MLAIYWLSMLGLVIHKVQQPAPVAQLAERFTCNEDVGGSNPLGGF